MASLVNGADVLDMLDVLDGMRRVKGNVNRVTTDRCSGVMLVSSNPSGRSDCCLVKLFADDKAIPDDKRTKQRSQTTGNAFKLWMATQDVR